MSVIVRPFQLERSKGRREGWEVDIRVRFPGKSVRRERLKAPVSSASAAKRWGEDREREMILEGPVSVPEPKKEVPKLEEFVPRFLDGYARANRQKPSGVAAKETILRVHVVPFLGGRKLDAITNEDVQGLKAKMVGKAPKTVNNTLTVLNTLLRVAKEWDVIDHVPCTIRLLRSVHYDAAFHDFDEYERLVEAAKVVDARARLIVLLGGEAGLRCGEVMALEWTDVDLPKRQIRVQRSDWKGQVTAPKGGRTRVVPMTSRLASAMQAHRHLRGVRVLCQDEGKPLTQKIVRDFVLKASRRALLRNQGVHILRHTFCSHLAMRGAPARAIQELAGHKDLSTTQRYMHLSPAAVESAIRLLEGPNPVQVRGDILETAVHEKPNVSGSNR